MTEGQPPCPFSSDSGTLPSPGEEPGFQASPSPQMWGDKWGSGPGWRGSDPRAWLRPLPQEAEPRVMADRRSQTPQADLSPSPCREAGTAEDVCFP